MTQKKLGLSEQDDRRLISNLGDYFQSHVDEQGVGQSISPPL